MCSISPINFIRTKWYWAKEKPLFWANLALIGGTLCWVFICPGPVTEAGPSDFRIKTWAMFLQLLGAYTVWHDLTSAAKTFGKDGFIKSTWEWLKAGVCGRNVTILLGSASFSMNGSSAGRIILRRSANLGAPIETRVEALEYNLTKIDEDLTNAFKEIRESEGKLSEQLTCESMKREAAHKDLRSALQDAVVGNYSKLAFGAFWVFVGIVLSAWAPEIAKVVAGQWSQVWKTI